MTRPRCDVSELVAKFFVLFLVVVKLLPLVPVFAALAPATMQHIDAV